MHPVDLSFNNRLRQTCCYTVIDDPVKTSSPGFNETGFKEYIGDMLITWDGRMLLSEPFDAIAFRKRTRIE